MLCVFWLTEFKSVTCVQRQVRTEWNVDSPTSKSILPWGRTLKETGTLASQIGKKIFETRPAPPSSICLSSLAQGFSAKDGDNSFIFRAAGPIESDGCSASNNRVIIIGLMEARWSASQIARQLGRSDWVVRRCWDPWILEMLYTRRPGPLGERLNPAFALQRLTTLTTGVKVWDTIAYNRRSPLVLIRDNMKAQCYVHDILQPHVLPLMQRLPGALFQQDNARPHTERVSLDCLRTVTTLPWPDSSPDLSSIEHIWDYLDGELDIPRV
ncbi:transposable element Tcb1 transposase [Trichonephila clavipes]|nr:transposable element Tcb1 transposase [Trichonephila clavipes]